MAERFSAQVDAIVRANKSRITALIRQSTNDLIDEAQTPVAKGGKMRVDTGFLRASGQLSLTGMPSGPARPIKPGEAAPPVYVAELDKVTADTPAIYFGWTASYAKYREAFDGFLVSALQNWQKINDNVVARIKAKVR